LRWRNPCTCRRHATTTQRRNGGSGLHVLNRGVRRANLFRDPGEYVTLLLVLAHAAKRIPMRLLAYTLMPNHWHLVLWPYNDGDLVRYVHWATLTHACRWHRGAGPVHGACLSGALQGDPHPDGPASARRLPLRGAECTTGGLVKRAEDWIWSSASIETDPDWPRLSPWPVQDPTAGSTSSTSQTTTTR